MTVQVNSLYLRFYRPTMPWGVMSEIVSKGLTAAFKGLATAPAVVPAVVFLVLLLARFVPGKTVPSAGHVALRLRSHSRGGGRGCRRRSRDRGRGCCRSARYGSRRGSRGCLGFFGSVIRCFHCHFL